MGIIIGLLILAFLALVSFVAIFFVPTSYYSEDLRKTVSTNGFRIGAVSTSLVFLLIGGIVWASGAATRVPARNLGVASSFGKVDSHVLKPGLHWLAPWKSVENLDTTVQTLKMLGDGNSKDANQIACVTVRLANQTTACVDAQVLWRIDSTDENVIRLYNTYKNNSEGVFDRVRDALVEIEVVHAIQNVYSKFDPLAGITSAGGNVPTSADVLESRALEVLRPTMPGIIVESLVINLTHYDQTTQDKLNAYAQALADTRIAEQQKAINEAIVEANKILAQNTATNDPGVKYANCLQLIRDLAAKNQLQNLPINALSCDSQTGNVIVNAGK